MTQTKNGKHPVPVALAALRRSAKAALELARRTGTPCFVRKDGEIVDIAKAKTKIRTTRRNASKRK